MLSWVASWFFMVEQVKIQWKVEASITMQRLSQVLSPELVAWQQNATEIGFEEMQRHKARDSIESFVTVQIYRADRFTKLMGCLRGELDSEIEEMDQLWLEHEFEIKSTGVRIA